MPPGLQKPLEVRMGCGKGAVEDWRARVGFLVESCYEAAVVDDKLRVKAFRLAGHSFRRFTSFSFAERIAGRPPTALERPRKIPAEFAEFRYAHDVCRIVPKNFTNRLDDKAPPQTKREIWPA